MFQKISNDTGRHTPKDRICFPELKFILWLKRGWRGWPNLSKIAPIMISQRQFFRWLFKLFTKFVLYFKLDDSFSVTSNVHLPNWASTATPSCTNQDNPKPEPEAWPTIYKALSCVALIVYWVETQKQSESPALSGLSRNAAISSHVQVDLCLVLKHPDARIFLLQGWATLLHSIHSSRNLASNKFL